MLESPFFKKCVLFCSGECHLLNAGEIKHFVAVFNQGYLFIINHAAVSTGILSLFVSFICLFGITAFGTGTVFLFTACLMSL